MPLFEYECRKCGHVTTFLESYHSGKSHECEKCGARDTVKRVSAFAAQVHAPSAGSSVSAGPSCPTGTCPLS